FYITSLSERSKSCLSADGPREDFAVCVEWMLVYNNSPFAICPAEDDTSPTPAPLEAISSPPVSDMTEILLEPTTHQGDQHAAMQEPEPDERTGEDIAPEPEPLTVSDLEHKPCLTISSSSALPPLLSFNPSASPISIENLPSVFQPPAPSSIEDPLAPPPATVPFAPPQPVNTSAPPWLLPPLASLETIGHPASPGSLVPPASPWSAVDLPAPSAPSGSGFPPSLPPSSVPTAQPLSYGIPAHMLVALAPKHNKN
ncbi:hypothetical protein DPX16_9019, partial [Anabarilius grahami]